MRVVLTFLLFFCILSLRSQSIDPFQHHAIRQHYDSLEIVDMMQTDTAKLKTICYYYTRSYLFEVTECNCTPPSAMLFDISEYEYLRKRNTRVERYFEKYGFKLTLLSINELTYRLPIHTP